MLRMLTETWEEETTVIKNDKQTNKKDTKQTRKQTSKLTDRLTKCYTGGVFALYFT